MVKNPPTNAGGVTDAGSIPGSERSLEEEMATHSSILAWRITTDKGVCWATVHRVAQRWIRLKQLSTHTLQNEGKMCRKPCLSVISTTGKKKKKKKLFFSGNFESMIYILGIFLNKQGNTSICFLLSRCWFRKKKCKSKSNTCGYKFQPCCTLWMSD